MTEIMNHTPSAKIEFAIQVLQKIPMYRGKTGDRKLNLEIDEAIRVLRQVKMEIVK